jgi:hypothetical protein
MSLGSSSTAGPPERAAAIASGDAVNTFAGVSIRLQYTETVENSSRGVERSALTAGVLKASPPVQRGGRLADERQYGNPAGK